LYFIRSVRGGRCYYSSRAPKKPSHAAVHLLCWRVVW